jgi:DUF4097 and DUF4098 domain-containing protein YvlB
MDRRMDLPRWARRAALAVAGLLVATLAAPAVFAHRIEKRFPVDVRPTVTVRNKSGKVVIKSWKKQEVLVVANHVSEKTEVDAEKMGNRVEVVTHVLSESITANDLQADYEVTVPEETELQIINDSGDVYVERVSGDMTFDTVAAAVELREVAGILVVKTISGSLTCYLCAGRVEVNTISGNLSFMQPVISKLRAKTNTGSILYDGVFERGGTYLFTNFSGTTEVRFSEGDSFDLMASSLHGKVENDAALKPSGHQQSYIPSNAAKALGRMNLGLARVEITSFSGTIKVRKR